VFVWLVAIIACEMCTKNDHQYIAKLTCSVAINASAVLTLWKVVHFINLPCTYLFAYLLTIKLSWYVQ